MIKYVGKDGIGYTEKQVKMIEVEEFIMDKEQKSNFETIEDAIKRGRAVTVWSDNDGDGNILSIDAHHDGFLIGLEGDNHLKEECRAGDRGYIATWFNFDMLDEMKKAMKKYAYLVEGNGSFEGKELQVNENKVEG